MILALAAAFAACNGPVKNAQQQEQAAPAQQEEEVATNVTAATAARQQVPQTEVYATTVQAYATNNIAPQSGGRIRKINVEVGDFVSAGQILAEMDRLNLDQAYLKLVNDSTELSRVKGLYEEGGVSKSDFESLELAYNVSKSSYENLLENTILRSPISGVVTARNYDRGDMYAMASPIFVVQQIKPVKLLVGISESDYTKVKKGDNVSIETDAVPGTVFSGKVDRIYPTIDAVTHTFQAEVVVTNNYATLRPGMYARAKLTFGINDSVVVPDGAIVKQQGSGQRSVFVINEDGTVSSRIVTLGRHCGESEFEILSGLEEGERVVVKGNAALRNGSKVNVME